jgi:hypothetical protein
LAWRGHRPTPWLAERKQSLGSPSISIQSRRDDVATRPFEYAPVLNPKGVKTVYWFTPKNRIGIDCLQLR